MNPILAIFSCLTALTAGTPTCQTHSLLQLASSQAPSVGGIAIYRLIGNDMPPLESRGQLRWNTKYALDYEPQFEGVTKRWVLNKIWNETEYTLIRNELLAAGVQPTDILSYCFDFKQVKTLKSPQSQMAYLGDINDGRNFGIRHGQQSGFEWTLMLDGNTFITKDSWSVIKAALNEASTKGKMYMKIPYHRLHSEQNPAWLNQGSTIDEVLEYAPIKGESQLAFHKSATVLFDTHHAYGQNSKAYALNAGGFCGPNMEASCQCASVPEGTEAVIQTQDVNFSYTRSCGLVARLWSYPTHEVLETGLSEDKEAGFFCFLEDNYPAVKDLQNGLPPSDSTEFCDLMKQAVQVWSVMSPAETQRYHRYSDGCEARCDKLVLTQWCIRATARKVAKAMALESLSIIAQSRNDLSRPFCSSSNQP
jgi:hypothetical protein